MIFPEITLTGSPYEKGFTHGSVCREQVLRSLDSYGRRFKRSKDLMWEEAHQHAQKFLSLFTGEYARYIEEMHGIADGAGVAFEDILTINLRTELLYTDFVEAERGNMGCTAFSAVPPVTAGNITLAGQTWDFTRSQREATVIARIPEEDGRPAILMFLEGGFVGGKGVNSAGISLTLNALSTKQGGIGIPLHIRMRRMLESRTLNAAYREATAAPIPFGANLILTHKDGISLSLELDPSGVDVIMPENGIIAHTNHYYGPKMILNHSHSAGASTYVRLQRMLQLMKSRDALTQADLESFCADHAGSPSSICTHPLPEHTPQQQLIDGATNYAFVIDLTNGIIRFACGNPCENGFETISLE